MDAPDPAERARSALLSAETYPLFHNIANTAVLLRVWRWPTFESWKSWTVLLTRDSLKVRRLVWQQAGGNGDDLLMVGSEATLATSIWMPLREALAACNIAPFEHIANDGIGLDGTVCGVEASTRSGSTRLTWWQQPPDSWRTLSELHTRAINQFESILPRHVAQNPR